jgi:small-conductance mechanosensitive channel
MNLLSDIFDPHTLTGALALGIVMLSLAIIMARLVGAWSQRIGIPRHLLIDETTASFIARLMQLACFSIAAILYAYLVPSLHKLGTALLASASIVSLVLGLAAQNTLGQLVAGFALLLYRPFKIGDVLLFNTPTGNETGTVKEFTLGYTKLLTKDNRWVIVPNNVMATSVFIRVK